MCDPSIRRLIQIGELAAACFLHSTQRACSAPRHFFRRRYAPYCAEALAIAGWDRRGLSRYRARTMRPCHTDVKTEPTTYCGRVRSFTPHLEFRAESTPVLSHDLLFRADAVAPGIDPARPRVRTVPARGHHAALCIGRN